MLYSGVPNKHILRLLNIYPLDFSLKFYSFAGLNLAVNEKLLQYTVGLLGIFMSLLSRWLELGTRVVYVSAR